MWWWRRLQRRRGCANRRAFGRKIVNDAISGGFSKINVHMRGGYTFPFTLYAWLRENERWSAVYTHPQDRVACAHKLTTYRLRLFFVHTAIASGIVSGISVTYGRGFRRIRVCNISAVHFLRYESAEEEEEEGKKTRQRYDKQAPVEIIMI